MPIVRSTLILVATAAYLGLAVLGWGGRAAFFSHPPLVALAVVVFVVAGASSFVGGNLSSGVREDRGNRWVIAALGVIGLLHGFLPAYADRMEFWTIDGDTIRWVGVVLFAAGGALRLWPVVVLGRRFSGLVAIQPGHTLVTSGVYGVIGHPSYLGWLVNSLGWALAFRSGVGVLLTALMIPPIVARIRAEEALLRMQFGEEYDAYRGRTSADSRALLGARPKTFWVAGRTRACCAASRATAVPRLAKPARHTNPRGSEQARARPLEPPRSASGGACPTAALASPAAA